MAGWKWHLEADIVYTALYIKPIERAIKLNAINWTIMLIIIAPGIDTSSDIEHLEKRGLFRVSERISSCRVSSSQLSIIF